MRSSRSAAALAVVIIALTLVLGHAAYKSCQSIIEQMSKHRIEVQHAE